MHRKTSRLYIVAGLMLTLAISLFAKSYYIELKASFAQLLIKQSWQQRLAGKTVPPWPWADTSVDARLKIGEQVIYVLSGANLRNLAFGPAFHAHSYPLERQASKVILGHRDTHFAHLEGLKVGDHIQLQLADGAQQKYQVDKLEVLDSRYQAIALQTQKDQLVLVSCYPFRSVNTEPHLRFVVTATRT